MRWTVENEELLLSLYLEVKIQYKKNMKKDVERYKWMAGKLRDGVKLEMSWKQVKDKISSVENKLAKAR